MLLPAGCLHHRGDCCPVRRPQHRDNASIALSRQQPSCSLARQRLRMRALQRAQAPPVRSMVSSRALTWRSSVRFMRPLGRTTDAPPRPRSRRGRISGRAWRPRLAPVPLRSARKASPFWIMLLLSSRTFEHGMIDQIRRAPDYEFGGRRFESFRARQLPWALSRFVLTWGHTRNGIGDARGTQMLVAA